MGLKRNHIENQRQAAEGRLAARQALLRGKGLDDKAQKRDPLIRKARSDIRRTTRRLERIDALEAQNAELARAKEGGGDEAGKKQGGKKQGGKQQGGKKSKEAQS